MRTSLLLALLAVSLSSVSTVRVQAKNDGQLLHGSHLVTSLRLRVTKKYIPLDSFPNKESLTDASTPSEDLEKLSESIKIATDNVEIAVSIAIMESYEILADAPTVLRHFLDTIGEATAAGKYIVESATREVINRYPNMDLAALAQDVLAVLEIILHSASNDIRDTVSEGASESLPQMEFILHKIEEECRVQSYRVLGVIEVLRGRRKPMKP